MIDKGQDFLKVKIFLLALHAQVVEHQVHNINPVCAKEMTAAKTLTVQECGEGEYFDIEIAHWKLSG